MKMTARQHEVLNAVIETHIETALPVGSANLKERCHMRYSAATVRNEMVFLEEAGFLTHPHTSSGRIPTDLGYRYYVDKCMQATEVRPSRADDLADISLGIEEPEHLAEEASRLLAAILRETSLVVVSRSVADNIRVYLQGSSHIMNKPEFQDINKVRSLFQVFEEKLKLVEIFLSGVEEEENLSVRIGQENTAEPFHKCAIISSPYYMHGVNSGRIAIVGPTRMQYDIAIPLVSRMAEMIGIVIDRRF